MGHLIGHYQNKKTKKVFLLLPSDDSVHVKLQSLEDDKTIYMENNVFKFTMERKPLIMEETFYFDGITFPKGVEYFDHLRSIGELEGKND